MKNINHIFIIIILLLSSSLFTFGQITEDNYKLLKQEFNQGTMKKILRNNLLTIDEIKDQNTNFNKDLKDSKGVEKDLSNSPSVPEGEAHAAINPTDSNNIVVGCMRNSSTDFGFSLYYTKDFGKTWSPSSVNLNPAGSNIMVVGGGDPVFSFNSSGKLYFTWLYLYIKNFSTDSVFIQMYWASSDDGGATWTREKNNNDIISSCVYSHGYFVKGSMPDKEWIATNPVNGDLYVGYTKFTNYSSDLFLDTKKNSDNYFSSSVKVSTSQIQSAYCSIATDKHGNIYDVYHANNDKSISQDYSFFFSKSIDGGKTFSSPVLLTKIEMPGLSNDQIKDTVTLTKINLTRNCANNQIAVDNSNSAFSGNIYMVWDANGLTKKLNNGLDIYFIKSTDGGKSWSVPSIVNNDNKDLTREQHNPTIFINNYGRIFIGWYDRRSLTDTADLNANFYVAYSDDGGDTFKQFPVTSSTTNFSSKILSTFNIGEYVQILATKNLIIPVWIDGRKNNGDMELYTAIFNVKESGIQEINPISDKFYVKNVSPNPIKDNVYFEITLNEKSHVNITLYDLSGKLMGNISDKNFNKGTYTQVYNGINLSPGKYFIVVKTDFGLAVKTFIR